MSELGCFPGCICSDCTGRAVKLATPPRTYRVKYEPLLPRSPILHAFKLELRRRDARGQVRRV